MTKIQKLLFELQDLKYREFNVKLIPNIDPETVIGVRTPELRKLAKEMSPQQAAKFMAELPHKYYEENNIHGFLIERIKDYDECIAELNKFLPYVDNWATCDSMRPKVFENHPVKLIEQVKIWIASNETYTVRFGLETLMSFYLDEHFCHEYLKFAAGVKSEEYYVKMMVAWFFATALAKQYGAAVKYIENGVLDTWTHNKTIQKAVESYRITGEQKAYLRTLKK